MTGLVYVPRTRRDGTDCSFKVEPYLANLNDRVQVRVQKKGWDYVAAVAGLPGSGKSKFAQLMAKYNCKWFDERYIAWNADKFLYITSKCPKHSAIILDESFNSMNSKIMYNPDFLRIINHLQIIRQKNLYIYLCLPNFFDLSKGIAIFRTSNLFVTFGDEDDNKGFYMCFGRKEKTQLYVKGSKFMDYNSYPANFHGKFPNHQIIDDEIYEKLKRKYTLQVETRLKGVVNDRMFTRFVTLVKYLKENKNMSYVDIAKASQVNLSTLKMLMGAYYKKQTEKY